MDVAEALTSASRSLDAAGVADPRREAASLLAYVLDRDRVFLIAHPEYVLNESERERFDSVVSRRSAREPFQYIVGYQEFYGLNFATRTGVLIPRPETEILVEAAISNLANCGRPMVFEVGVGSGCISISVLKNVANAVAIATDISNDALRLASVNAENHHVDDRLELRHGDLFAGWSGAVDLIVSNPPYIPHGDSQTIQPEVRCEPSEALYAGAKGLDVIQRLVSGAPRLLKPGGSILIEIGQNQSSLVNILFDHALWLAPTFAKDLEGIDRVACAKLR